MIELLEPLATIPGVCYVMMVTHDGVPITMPGGDAGQVDRSADFGGMGRDDALAALATGWLADLAQATGRLSWNAPERAVLRAGRGTLVLQRMRSAILLVILSKGLDPQSVRLAMDGTAARIERMLRSMGMEPELPQSNESVEPRAALPSSSESSWAS